MCPNCSKTATHILTFIDVEDDEVIVEHMCLGHAVRTRRVLESQGVLAEVSQNIFRSIPRFAVDYEPVPA